jgi:hypothetical protein
MRIFSKRRCKKILYECKFRQKVLEKASVMEKNSVTPMFLGKLENREIFRIKEFSERILPKFCNICEG